MTIQSLKKPVSQINMNTPELSVLLVEDHFINQQLITRMLRSFVPQVDIANHGLEALAAIKDGNSYDLILMDIRMPEMDGITAARTIRAMPEPTNQVPIIALTANTSPTDTSEYIDAGMNAVVGKPIDINQLRRTIFDLTAHRECRTS